MIRNFVIIAHIDHGKSTLADRFLEFTGTIAGRKMKEQYLDQLELERERGITIKMAPVRMMYNDVTLNLIDTPGHSDFSYEVSRALKAVEGAILLVDATQGIQAQTLANFHLAKEHKLTVIGALNKIDLNPTGVDTLSEELADLIGTTPENIFRVSGKTGDGVPELLQAVVDRVPPPETRGEKSALIFSSHYDDHKGVVAFVRVFGGAFQRGEQTKMLAFNRTFLIKEVGYFAPELTACTILTSGDIGYIATGIKDPDAINIGDTVGENALQGFRIPQSTVFVSVYPSNNSEYDDLKLAIHKLRLTDSSLIFTQDFSTVLGRGFKCGFLGKLHFEIIIQRLLQEFGCEVVTSFPSVAYKVKPKAIGKQSGVLELDAAGFMTIENPKDFPDDYMEAQEPYIRIAILTSAHYVGAVLGLAGSFRLDNIETKTCSNGIAVIAEMPLSELISDFDDALKSVSEGFASFSYELIEYRRVESQRLDILVAEELVPGLSRIIHKNDIEREGRQMVERLKNLLPRQQFVQAIQAAVGSKIVARENIPALRKDVTGYLYGGDRSRKMKLWKKQQRGKKRLKNIGRVEVPVEVFKELLKK
ncbi:MAG: translation elongation factor 4 [bacterium]